MRGVCLPIAELRDCDLEVMFALLDRHFLAVDGDQFAADLRAKDRVVLLYENDTLAGFSTFTLRSSRDLGNREVSILCSGDTIIDPEHWGSSALGRTLIQSAWDLHRESGREALWWLLITSGPRTWGVLPTFFRIFHPHPENAPDPDLAPWLGKLCETRWPGRRDPVSGLIRLAHPQKLRPPLDRVPHSRLEDAGVKWYLEKNPRWREGDELPSLVKIDPENLTRAGRRYLTDYLETQP